VKCNMGQRFSPEGIKRIVLCDVMQKSLQLRQDSCGSFYAQIQLSKLRDVMSILTSQRH